MLDAATRFLTLISPLDWVAVALLLAAWGGTGLLVERAGVATPSTNMLMRGYRLAWMREMVKRDVRIFDANILQSLRDGASFFISACMIGIGGGVALLGQTDRLASFAADLSPAIAAPRVVWEAKILLVVLILASAFLKFIWAHRLFGYCAIVMAATPSDVVSGSPMAEKAGWLNIYAARSFNRGLRAVYFALAALAWLLGPLALIVATLATLSTLWRREYASHSREVLLGRGPVSAPPPARPPE